MVDLKFADAHNLVAFLSKPVECEGFEQIVDFPNAKPINYALTVNPTIYTLCIEKFWSTVKGKTVNGEVQLQALVDGKKIIVTKESVRRDLQLKDDEGTDCLPNATIFEQLTLMSGKITAWNEFSSTMASAIICLATNQKFNFSKYNFESMVRNVENVFLMYSRFVQVFVNQQVGNMSHHKRIYFTPSHTKKIFGNIKREGKGISGRVTPLFPTMMVQAQEEMGEGSANPTDPHHTPTIIQPSTSQPQKKQKLRKPKRKDTEVPQPSGPTTNVANKAINEENVSKHSNDPLLSGEDSLKLEELMFEKKAKKLEKKDRKRTHKLKRLYMVGLSARVVSSEYKSLGEEDASKHGRKIHDINADEDITLENVHDAEMFDVNELHGDEVFVEKEVPVKEVSVVGKVNAASLATTVSAATIIKVDSTLAQALAELKSARPKATTTAATTITAPSTRPKAKELIIDEHEQAPTPTPIVSSSQSSQFKVQDKGKGIMAKIKIDYELSQRLQAEEQEELTIEEKAILFQQLLEKRRKHFAAKRAEEKRNRPPTKAQQRSMMTTYLKNMAGWKPKDLKNKSFANIQELFDKVMKRVNTFVDFRTELVEGTEMEESSKKVDQKVDVEKETEQEKAELQSLMEIVSDEEGIAIDAIPSATKPPSIVD
ncbi:hypothetical protein Tco_0065301 [Tanacetum coccineum]